MALPALYELTSMYREALEVLTDSDLPDDVVRDTLDGLEGEVQQKATNVAMFCRNLESLADQIDAAEKQMEQRKRALRARAGRIRDYLKQNMELAGITEITCPFFKLAIRRNPPSVQIEDVTKLPPEYLVTPPTPPPTPDKVSLARDLKAGKAVPGAVLVNDKTRLEIR